MYKYILKRIIRTMDGLVIGVFVVLLLAAVVYFMTRGLSDADKAIVAAVSVLIKPVSDLVGDAKSQASAAADADKAASAGLAAADYNKIGESSKAATAASNAATNDVMQLQEIMTKYQVLATQMTDATTKASFTADIANKTTLVTQAQSYAQQAAASAAKVQQTTSAASAQMKASDNKTTDDMMVLSLVILDLINDLKNQATIADKFAQQAAADFNIAKYGSVAGSSNGANAASQAAASDVALIRPKFAQLQTLLTQIIKPSLKTDMLSKLPMYDPANTVIAGYVSSAAASAQNAATILGKAAAAMATVTSLFQPKGQKGGIKYSSGDLTNPTLNLNLTGAQISEYDCQKAFLAKYPLVNGKPVANASNLFGLGYTYVPSTNTCNTILATGNVGNRTIQYYSDPTDATSAKYSLPNFNFGGFDDPVYGGSTGNSGVADCSTKCLAGGSDCTLQVNSSNGCWVKSLPKPTAAGNTYGATSDAITRLRIDFPPV